ncbi:hypothetical protein [Sediminibacterium sp.]|uniref:hypothetical protein n=1 Tax=Sediminibacterium sp. TaxID=1917865 RepID=UPI003F7032FF
MRFILCCLLANFSNFLIAQNVTVARPTHHFIEVYDEHGKLLSSNVPGVKGSPLWKDESRTATVELFNGRIHRNISVLVNLVNGKINFIQNNKEFEFSEPIKKVTIYHSEEGRDDSTQFIKLVAYDSLLYQVKAKGLNYSLINRIHKKVVENYDYGKSSTNLSFQLFNDFFLLDVNNNLINPIKGKSFEELFPKDIDRAAQLFPKFKKSKRLSVQEISSIIAAL